jgi:hypothetical protein
MMETKLHQAVSGSPSQSYAQVLAKLDAIDRAIGVRDGLCWFNRLYRAMTDAVAKRAQAGAFEDPAFMEVLDCTFADLYFAAVTARLRKPRSEPRAWTAVFDARANARISPLQFAVAGVNAHINRDLPVALVASFKRAGGAPERDSARHADYLAVNRVLREVHTQAKTVLATGLAAGVDVLLGDADDAFELWSLDRARDAAWVAGEVQWHLRVAPFLAQQHLSTLDQLVGCAGRSLLRPVPVVVGS